MLLIEQTVFQKMTTSVINSVDESCGFLFGYESDKNRIITKSMAVKNSLAGDKTCAFEITANDYMFAEYVGSWEKLQLLGIYHSHPNDNALPSCYDETAAQPYFSYIIFSIMAQQIADIKSWRLQNKKELKEEKISIFTIQYNENGDNIYSHSPQKIYQ